MSTLPKIGSYTEVAQRLFCLLFVLREMPIGAPRKQEVISYIQQHGYLAIAPNDVEHYLTQTELKWHTDIAFRRKDGVEYGLLFNNMRDCWDLTRDGKELIEKVIEAGKTKRFDVKKCYLWTPKFRRMIDPDYVPSAQDAPRPEKFRITPEILALLEKV